MQEIPIYRVAIWLFCSLAASHGGEGIGVGGGELRLAARGARVGARRGDRGLARQIADEGRQVPARELGRDFGWAWSGLPARQGGGLRAPDGFARRRTASRAIHHRGR